MNERTSMDFLFILGVGSINRIAEIVGLSSQLMDFIERAKAHPELNPIKEMQQVVSNEFSSRLLMPS